MGSFGTKVNNLFFHIDVLYDNKSANFDVQGTSNWYFGSTTVSVRVEVEWFTLSSHMELVLKFRGRKWCAIIKCWDGSKLDSSVHTYSNLLLDIYTEDIESLAEGCCAGFLVSLLDFGWNIMMEDVVFGKVEGISTR